MKKRINKFDLKCIFIFIVFLIPIISLADYNDYKDYPQYLEGSDLIPIIRDKNCSLQEISYNAMLGERESIDNEWYYVVEGIYYFNDSCLYFDFGCRPNYARAKSVEQTIKQRCVKEKREPTIQEKKTLKFIDDSKQLIEKLDFFYKQRKEIEYNKTEKRILIGKVYSYIFFIFLLIVALITLVNIRKNNKKKSFNLSNK